MKAFNLRALFNWGRSSFYGILSITAYTWNNVNDGTVSFYLDIFHRCVAFEQPIQEVERKYLLGVSLLVS